MACRSLIIRCSTCRSLRGHRWTGSSCALSHQIPSSARKKQCSSCAILEEARCRLFLRNTVWVALLLGAMGLTACRQDMHNQPRYKPLAGTDFFGDRRSARYTIEDTVARGQLHIDDARYT